MRQVRLWASAAGMALVSVCGVAAVADEPGTEWKQVTEEEAKIVLAAPGLEGGLARFYKSQHPYKFHQNEVGTWIGPSGEYPRMTVHYTRLGPGYHFRSKHSPKEIIQGWQDAKDITFGDAKKGSNSLGPLAYVEFAASSEKCMAFVQYWGFTALHEGPESEGTSMLYGSYCVDAADGLSPESVAAVLKGIDIKGISVPEPVSK